MSANKDLTNLVFDDENLQKPDPFSVFTQWLEEAKISEINDANAMALASVDKDGLPDCRIMLLNGMEKNGFVFYTNTHSAKGEEIALNPKACLLFHWKSARRQVRIRGELKPVPAAVSDAYFATRPRGSQIGAHASKQSSSLQTRQELAARVEKLTAEFAGSDVPRPEHWMGFVLEPVQIEFWQNGEFRLHDRMVYTRQNPNYPWQTRRLNP